MSEPITFRRFGPADLDLLMSVPEGLFDQPLKRDQSRAFLADPHNELVLAYAKDLAVGLASGTVLRHPDKTPSFFINEIGVRTAYQRRGIGAEITLCLIAIARAKGCQGIWLGTEADNAPAIALYRRLKGDALQGVFFGWDGALD